LAIFQFQQESIAQTLCVKRAIPSNTCKGKCYLNKKLKEVQESSSDESEKQLSPKFQKLEYIQEVRLAIVNELVFVPIISSTPLISSKLQECSLGEIFHPPLV